jgi:PAS domain S-box-containing protein
MIIRAKREWERTVDSLGEMIALIDRNHSLIRVNKAMAEALGKVPPEIVGKTYYLSTQGFNNKQQAEEDMALLSTGKPVTGEFYDESREAQYEINLTPYYDTDDRTIIGSVYIARDITSR